MSGLNFDVNTLTPEQAVELEKQLANWKTNNRQKVIDQVNSLIQLHNLKETELKFTETTSRTTGTRVSHKYAHPETGKVLSTAGNLKPADKALIAGKKDDQTREQFFIANNWKKVE
jgi:hypothetical protein